MFMKKFLFVSLLSLTVGIFGACGGDEGDEKKPAPTPGETDGSVDVVWECACDAICDGDFESVEFDGCGSMQDAQKALDSVVAECEVELNKECVFDGECNCECEPTQQSC